jgi:hypothetical protein
MMRTRSALLRLLALPLALSGLLAACSSDPATPQPSGSGGSGGSGGNACTPSGATEAACSDGVDDDCDGQVDCADSDCNKAACGAGMTCTAGGCVPDGLFPELPPLERVKAEVHGDRASITFEPVAGARDYRVYPLPASKDQVRVDPDGYVAITNATYRCAGDREAPFVPLNDKAANSWVHTYTTGEVAGYMRTEAENTLGHVWLDPGPGRVPVYAVGSPVPDGDNQCDGRFAETRAKRYTTDKAEYEKLVSERWRDDGIVFYVPEADGADTTTIYEDTTHWSDAWVYFPEGPEKDAAGMPVPRLRALKAAAQGTVPLMRVHYDACMVAHDELLAGKARFDRAATQGNQPVWEVQWSGLTQKTTLVVEALDAGCPFQGHLSPKSIPPTGYAKEFVTIDQVRATAKDGEVFVNGQHDPTQRPRATHRWLVEVEPEPAPQMDAFYGFSPSDPPETFTYLSKQTFGGWNLFAESEHFDASFYSIEPDVWAAGTVGGELWVAYADWAADTNGKSRFTAKQKATLADSSFVHATMSVDIVSTGRRYPQLWISDQPSPVQDNLAMGTTINVQTISPWPTQLQLQLCDHRTWDVNNQCPGFELERKMFTDEPWAPHDVVGEHAAVARLARIDVYASTSRVYVLLDGEPYGCANLPAGAIKPGQATVTWGDVLYHSGVDEPVVGTNHYTFHKNYQLTETRRHFDNLGFSSGKSAPTWDEAKLPCASVLQ